MSLPRPYRIPSPPPARGSNSQYSTIRSYSPLHSPALSSVDDEPPTDDTTHLVVRGDLGAGFTPYPATKEAGADLQRNSTTRYSAALSSTNLKSTHGKGPLLAIGAFSATNAIPSQWDLARESDTEDELDHHDTLRDTARNVFSTRGFANAIVLVLIVVGIILLFVAYPVISYIVFPPDQTGFLLMNSTGQIGGSSGGMRGIIDDDTPKDVRTRVGFDGQSYHLVFSDEFNTDGRSFGEGEDPYWEAVNLHYWPTVDLEWYDPDQIRTKDGKLVITIDQQQNHDLNYISGMLQSWNKFCFTNGYIEVSLSLPGDPQISGFWPAAWTMGNLGRAGYGATTEGLWPYSYKACDLGTLKNQTEPSGVAPTASDGQPLSFQPGQRLSSCSCPGSDHPGPKHESPRNAPEIDILEATVDVALGHGIASQSYQLAPYNADWQFNNASPAVEIADASLTQLNTYLGAPYQQALSALTDFGAAPYGGVQFQSFGYEYHSGDDGYITWSIGGKPTWTLRADALDGDAQSGISKRVMPEEPMSIILNLGMSESFQEVDTANLQFPAKMYVDYVRVYQRDGEDNIGCEPKNFPMQDYINKHINAYTNPNFTTWAEAGYTFPKNRLVDNC
ncbi:beta-glucan synthesis-associated [Auricularia subglabra TFB-10046 SS5]|nr:beta-glucan synthesis-associated [Auricularia subglabra TFB-10046 SS5]